MERREDVLKQAINANAIETERWLTFKAENEETIKNLNMFSERLTVDIMVPIGTKAFMPGHLIHTNELLVGHYQGYFSKCSAHKAKEICQHRLRLAEGHLKKLETEAELWQNKLETPYLKGALPSEGEIDIREEYNEEEHQRWLEKHKKSVKEEKHAHRSPQQIPPDEDLFKELENREMIEELGLDNLDEEALGKLLCKGVSVPLEVEQVNTIESNDCDKEAAKHMTDEQVFDILERLEAQERNDLADISAEAEESLKGTNDLVHNLMSNQVKVPGEKTRIGRVQNQTQGVEVSNRNDNDEEVYIETDGGEPEEVQLIRNQIELLPIEERVEFLTSQLSILRAKMRKIQRDNTISDELTHLMDVLVYLEDDLQGLIFEQENIGDEIEADGEPLTECESESVVENAPNNKKRRISFAMSEEKLEFRQNETVAEMLTNATTHSRDIIHLDTSLHHVQTFPHDAKLNGSPVAGSSDILKKVEENIEFVKENQSVKDFDLVNQILEQSTGRINTLHIDFHHSDAAPAVASVNDQDEDTPGTPADFYTIYRKCLEQDQHSFPIYVNSFEGEDQLKVPILNEAARSEAYGDPRTQFSNPQATHEKSHESVPTPQSKSILRNKAAVEREPRTKENVSKSKNGKKQKKKERTIDDDIGDLSAYYKVMHDLVEKEPTAPEPLPNGKFIDAHTPKKRISRFKQQRALNKT
ncbi:unconventional prefoldin RPB5 interactor-like protein [Scaptodrosophila lebanonensis]|uniref:Unconventional prefoldin RPB5 interactor-like protein n=1 Tax=Drosophila lebanonensis TaxID=7225 RepID=A0A6J2U3E6_DROLE|nr:unconventional prefoldin RPB5 interactor-like protein [Scaptodrosophila lebanonensis]